MLVDGQKATLNETLTAYVNSHLTPSIISQIHHKAGELGRCSISVSTNERGELQITYKDSNGQTLLIQNVRASLETSRSTPTKFIEDDGQDLGI